jgi:uncharacterized protein YprB with RNaseH-like and TPR domain
MSARTFRERYGSLATEGRPPPPFEPTPGRDDWPAQPGGRLVETAFGPLSMHQHVYSGPTILEARRRFESAAGADPAGIDPAGIVVLDTETTGLAGGTGTWTFLVGLGRFSGDDFVVRQLFMRHPGDEPALIATLAAELSRVETLITYNGRAFDVPLIETRFRLHGRSVPLEGLHVDLLAPARAIWKHRLPSCSLGEVERAILGVTRELDAPGWMIPQLYFGYLRTRDITALEPVFAHNRMDIVSLARLAALVHGWEAGIDAPDDAIDALALALHRVRRVDDEATLDVLRRLWRQPTAPSDLRLRGLREWGLRCKRTGRYDEAAAEWRLALRDPSRGIRLHAAEELAKYLEHRARDHAGALAITRAGADSAFLARDGEALAAFQRRATRLERKLARLAGPPAADDGWVGETSW